MVWYGLYVWYIAYEVKLMYLTYALKDIFKWEIYIHKLYLILLIMIERSKLRN